MADKAHKVKGEKVGEDFNKPTIVMPKFRISENDLPEIKNWTVGGKYKLMVDVEMISAGKNEWDSKDETVFAQLEVQEAQVMGNYIKDMPSKEFAKFRAKVVK